MKHWLPLFLTALAWTSCAEEPLNLLTRQLSLQKPVFPRL